LAFYRNEAILIYDSATVGHWTGHKGDGAVATARLDVTVDTVQPSQGPTEGRLSSKEIPADERLIFALDTNLMKARRLVWELGDAVRFYKLGLEVLMSGNYLELTKELVGEGKKVLLDFKSFDVPRTVAAAVREARASNATFATVHGNDAMLRAAVDESNGVGILAVTVLTSLDQADLTALGFQVSVEELVLSRAKRALAIGCAGVISSGVEVPALRDELGERFVIVVPGIRPVENRDDHKRTVDVEEAFLNGADYIVVGRPIREAGDPRAAAQVIQGQIAALFDS
jgi:orotidine-5'-phosphate decarboxylase